MIAGEALTTEIVTRGHHRATPAIAACAIATTIIVTACAIAVPPPAYSHGDPNSRNPAAAGYMQRKGTTSGGPRY